MLTLALFLLAAPECRELHDGHPRFSPSGDTGYENYKVAIVECAGDREVVFSKRASASAEWVEVHRKPVSAPKSNFTWFFDGGTCAPKNEKTPTFLNHAILAHASAANGQIDKFTPVEAWHVDLKKNVWVRDDAKKIVCEADQG